MGRSQESFNKKEKEKKRLKKRQEKLAKREERKNNPKRTGDDMIGYVDEYGNPTDTPPDPANKIEVNAEDIVIGVPKKEEVAEDSEYSGTVEFFNHDKGFGFIKDSNSKEKYFVHISGTTEEIDEGDKVVFELEKGVRGMNAVNVKKG